MAADDRKRLKSTVLQYKNEIFLAGLIVFVGAGVFVFFKSFFDSGINNLTTEILAALLGSIITIIITMLLIRQQGTIEQTMETATASKTMVFNEKLRLFREFVEAYTKFVIDNELSPPVVLHRAVTCLHRASRVIGSDCEYRARLGVRNDAKGARAACVSSSPDVRKMQTGPIGPKRPVIVGLTIALTRDLCNIRVSPEKLEVLSL